MTNLSKGQKIAITQTDITIGLGWILNTGASATLDLDCSIFLLDANKMIPTEQHFVFYGNLKSPDNAVQHSDDNKTDANTNDGDNEQIKVNIATLSANIKELLFVVTINEAQARSQNFGMIRDAYIRIVDNITGLEIAKYKRDEDFSIETAIEFGRLYEREGVWKFDASGVGYKEDLAFFVQKYYAGPVQK